MLIPSFTFIKPTFCIPEIYFSNHPRDNYERRDLNNLFPPTLSNLFGLRASLANTDYYSLIAEGLVLGG